MVHKDTNLTIYLIRHGQSEANVKAEFIGGRSEATPLSDLGKMQAKKLGKRFVSEKVKLDAIYSSTILRSKMTAEIALKEMGISKEKIVEVDALGELAEGEWEGKSREEIYNDQTLQYINSKGALFVPPGGESQVMVEYRMSGWFLSEILNNTKYLKKEGSIAVFSHGIAIKCFLHFVMNFDERLIYRMRLDNTSICKLKLTKEGWFVEGLNDTAHLYSESV